MLLPTPGTVNRLLGSFIFLAMIVQLLIFPQLLGMLPNGPAVCFSRRNPTTAPGRVLVPRGSGATKLSRCKEGLARVFAVMVQILLSITRVAVQGLVGAANLSPATKLVGITGAVSRYNVDRSQKTVKVY